MYQTTTIEANTSTSESSPNAISASEPAAIPNPMVTKTSIRFHAIVAYCRRRPRCRNASFDCPVEVMSRSASHAVPSQRPTVQSAYPVETVAKRGKRYLRALDLMDALLVAEHVLGRRRLDIVQIGELEAARPRQRQRVVV